MELPGQVVLPSCFSDSSKATSLDRITANIPSGSVLVRTGQFCASWSYTSDTRAAFRIEHTIPVVPFGILPSLRASCRKIKGKKGLLVAEPMKPACLVPQFSGVTSEESFLHGWKVCNNPYQWRFPLFDKGWAHISPLGTQFPLPDCQLSQHI